jgi:hypothetical protein
MTNESKALCHILVTDFLTRIHQLANYSFHYGVIPCHPPQAGEPNLEAIGAADHHMVYKFITL